MFKKIFKSKKRREHEKKVAEQRRLIRLAKENGIYIPDSFVPSSNAPKGCGIKGMPIGWYTSLNRRAEIAERELKKRDLI